MFIKMLWYAQLQETVGGTLMAVKDCINIYLHGRINKQKIIGHTIYFKSSTTLVRRSISRNFHFMIFNYMFYNCSTVYTLFSISYFNQSRFAQYFGIVNFKYKICQNIFLNVHNILKSWIITSSKKKLCLKNETKLNVK